MNKSLITLSLLAAVVTISCSNPKEDTIVEDVVSVIDTREPAPDNAHNSMNSLDWSGTYKGTVPCASCEGIETELVLNEDKTYKLTTNYLGRNDALEEENTGTFTWSKDGSIVTLSKVEDAPNQYKVG